MTNPNSRIIEEELKRRRTEADGVYYEKPDGNHPDIWEVRDRVKGVVNYILGEEHEDCENILGQLLKPKPKGGFVRRMFGGLSRKLSNWFSGEQPVKIGKFEFPKRNEDDFQTVISTMQDVVPVRYLLEEEPLPETNPFKEEDAMNKEEKEVYVAMSTTEKREYDLKRESTDKLLGLRRNIVNLLGEGNTEEERVKVLQDPEIAFVYRDLRLHGVEDYEYATQALSKFVLSIPALVPSSPTTRISEAIESLNALIVKYKDDSDKELDDDEKETVKSVFELFGNSGKKKFAKFEELATECRRLTRDYPDAEIVEEDGRKQVEYDEGKIKVPKGFNALYEPISIVGNLDNIVSLSGKKGDDLIKYLRAIIRLGNVVKKALDSSPSTPESKPKPQRPTIFQLRLLANAHRIARQRWQLLQTGPPLHAIPISPDDFKQAYIQAYLDHFEFENEDLKKAALMHAVRQLEEEKSSDGITFDEILKKIGFGKLRKILCPDSTDEEISHAIADGEIPLNEIPELVAQLRRALISGRFDGRSLSLEDNFAPVVLRLHRLHRLYRLADRLELEVLDEVKLKDGTEIFLNLVRQEAEEARIVLREAQAAQVGKLCASKTESTTPARTVAGKVTDAVKKGASAVREAVDTPEIREVADAGIAEAKKVGLALLLDNAGDFIRRTVSMSKVRDFIKRNILRRRRH